MDVPLNARFKTARSVVNLRNGRNDWYRISNSSAGPADIAIYDEIGYFGVTAKAFLDDLRSVKSDEINLHLNTPGGEVFDGIAIYNALKQHPAKVVVTVDSLAASIGSVIAMAGDEIIMAKNSTMMIHDGHGLCVGNAADMQEMAQLLNKTSDNIASIYAERTGKPAAEWRKRMRAETWYSAEEAVSAGLADTVLGQSGSEAQQASWDLSIFNFASREASPGPGLEAQPETHETQEDDFDAEGIAEALREAFQ